MGILPYDLALSRQDYWAVFQRGLHDHDFINESRLPVFHQLDIRIDKQFNLKMGIYILYGYSKCLPFKY